MLLKRFLFLAPDASTGGGGIVTLTLEQQLTALRSESEGLRGQITALTAERDAARSEVASLTGQFNAATQTATTATADLATARANFATVTGERDTARTALASASANITRLETLCGVKGVNPSAAVPAIESAEGHGSGAAAGHIFDQWMAAEGPEKRQLYAKHKTEIRAEAARREYARTHTKR